MQDLLAALAYQTARADEAVKQRDGWKTQAKEWEDLYTTANKRGDLLLGATGDRKEAQAQTGLALAVMTAQHNDDKGFIKEQNDYIRKLEGRQFKIAAVSFVGGFGTCIATNIPNIFGR